MERLLTAEAVERSTFLITVSFFDEDGAAAVPDAAKWTLSNGDGAVINSRSAVAIVAPESVEQVVLSGADLQMETTRDRELRIFTVEWTYSSGRTVKEEARFYVRGLTAVG